MVRTEGILTWEMFSKDENINLYLKTQEEFNIVLDYIVRNHNEININTGFIDDSLYYICNNILERDYMIHDYSLYDYYYTIDQCEFLNNKAKSINSTKRTLLLICGKSASGKTEITKALNDQKIKMLISHTDRPKRNNETDGIDYYFIKASDMVNMIDDGEFIETRSYNTEYGVWNYGLSKDEIDNIDTAACVVLDLNGCESVKKYIEDNNLDIKTVTIYISASEEERFRRYMKRDNVTLKQAKELIRRFEKDDEDFKDFESRIDIMLRNETEEDLERNIKIIKNIIDK